MLVYFPQDESPCICSCDSFVKITKIIVNGPVSSPHIRQHRSLCFVCVQDCGIVTAKHQSINENQGHCLVFWLLYCTPSWISLTLAQVRDKVEPCFEVYLWFILLRIIPIYTVQCRYNMVQFITILFLAMQWQQQILNQTCNWKQTPHIWPLQASHGVAIVRIIDCVLTAPHCTRCDHHISGSIEACALCAFKSVGE